MKSKWKERCEITFKKDENGDDKNKIKYHLEKRRDRKILGKQRKVCSLKYEKGK